MPYLRIIRSPRIITTGNIIMIWKNRFNCNRIIRQIIEVRSLNLSKIIAESVEEIGTSYFFFNNIDLMARPDPPGVARNA